MKNIVSLSAYEAAANEIIDHRHSNVMIHFLESWNSIERVHVDQVTKEFVTGIFRRTDDKFLFGRVSLNNPSR